MKNVAFLLLMILSVQNISSQIRSSSYDKSKDNQDFTLVSHTVKMGETVRTISQKYLVTPVEIYKVNKFAVDGISPGMTLQIPVPQKIADNPTEKQEPENVEETSPQEPAETAQSQDQKHAVRSGETLSGIAEQYGTTVEAIEQANPKVAKRGLYADETIVIPSSAGLIPSNDDASVGSAAQHTTTHKVEPGETLSGLAEKYHVPMNAIKRANSRLLAHGLQAGQVLKIPVE